MKGIRTVSRLSRLSRWGGLRRLHVLRSLLLSRRSGGTVRVHRPATTQVAGSMRVGGRLDVGLRWGHNGFAAPSQLYVAASGAVRVEGSFHVFAGTRIVVDDDAVLTIGSGYINSDARIACFSAITIGHDVAIAEQVVIRDSDNHQVKSAMGDQHPHTAPIRIGDHVWIGLGATILKGVTIGDGAVVAARAVVTRDVPPGALVAGVPARVIRADVVWE